MRMRYQAVIFDFNGTMFYDSAYHNQVWKDIYKEYRGVELTDEELASSIHGRNNEKIIEFMTEGKLSQAENEALSKEKEARYRKLCREHPETTVLAPGLIEFLNELKKRNIPFTIASASIKENIDFFISTFHLDTWMDPSLIVYDDGSYPDKVSMFQTAAKHLQVPIEECLIFEDSDSGIRFAKGAGAKGIIAINSTQDKERYAKFPYVLAVLNDYVDFPYEILE